MAAWGINWHDHQMQNNPPYKRSIDAKNAMYRDANIADVKREIEQFHNRFANIDIIMEDEV